MKKKDFDILRKMLLIQRENIVKIVQKNCKDEKDFFTNEVGDTADIASDSFEKELLFELNDNERKILKNIDEALENMEKGLYGICDSCGKIIEMERLKVMPFTKFCIDCKFKTDSH